MENPRSWTPLHKEINVAYYGDGLDRDDATRVKAVLDVVRRVKPEISFAQVETIIASHKKQLQDQMCGLSLCSQLVNGLGLQTT